MTKSNAMELEIEEVGVAISIDVSHAYLLKGLKVSLSRSDSLDKYRDKYR